MDCTSVRAKWMAAPFFTISVHGLRLEELAGGGGGGGGGGRADRIDQARKGKHKPFQRKNPYFGGSGTARSLSRTGLSPAGDILLPVKCFSY